jgi:hypothetical protein
MDSVRRKEVSNDPLTFGREREGREGGTGRSRRAARKQQHRTPQGIASVPDRFVGRRHAVHREQGHRDAVRDGFQRGLQ